MVMKYRFRYTNRHIRDTYNHILPTNYAMILLSVTTGNFVRRRTHLAYFNVTAVSDLPSTTTRHLRCQIVLFVLSRKHCYRIGVALRP